MSPLKKKIKLEVVSALIWYWCEEVICGHTSL